MRSTRRSKDKITPPQRKSCEVKAKRSKVKSLYDDDDDVNLNTSSNSDEDILIEPNQDFTHDNMNFSFSYQPSNSFMMLPTKKKKSKNKLKNKLKSFFESTSSTLPKEQTHELSEGNEKKYQDDKKKKKHHRRHTQDKVDDSREKKLKSKSEAKHHHSLFGRNKGKLRDVKSESNIFQHQSPIKGEEKFSILFDLSCDDNTSDYSNTFGYSADNDQKADQSNKPKKNPKVSTKNSIIIENPENGITIQSDYNGNGNSDFKDINIWGKNISAIFEGGEEEEGDEKIETNETNNYVDKETNENSMQTNEDTEIEIESEIKTNIDNEDYSIPEEKVDRIDIDEPVSLNQSSENWNFVKSTDKDWNNLKSILANSGTSLEDVLLHDNVVSSFNFGRKELSEYMRTHISGILTVFDQSESKKMLWTIHQLFMSKNATLIQELASNLKLVDLIAKIIDDRANFSLYRLGLLFEIMTAINNQYSDDIFTHFYVSTKFFSSLLNSIDLDCVFNFLIQLAQCQNSKNHSFIWGYFCALLNPTLPKSTAPKDWVVVIDSVRRCGQIVLNDYKRKQLLSFFKVFICIFPQDNAFKDNLSAELPLICNVISTESELSVLIELGFYLKPQKCIVDIVTGVLKRTTDYSSFTKLNALSYVTRHFEPSFLSTVLASVYQIFSKPNVKHNNIVLAQIHELTLTAMENINIKGFFAKCMQSIIASCWNDPLVVKNLVMRTYLLQISAEVGNFPYFDGWIEFQKRVVRRYLRREMIPYDFKIDMSDIDNEVLQDLIQSTKSKETIELRHSEPVVCQIQRKRKKIVLNTTDDLVRQATFIISENDQPVKIVNLFKAKKPRRPSDGCFRTGPISILDELFNTTSFMVPRKVEKNELIIQRDVAVPHESTPDKSKKKHKKCNIS